jgi:hypothetical protein
MHTHVYRDWRQLPCLVGDLRPSRKDAEDDNFVLFIGHVDSWYQGAMDNGSANATMLEVGRILAMHRLALRRGVRLAFWSGHSHGRYSGSAWYADTFWLDLYDHCIAHVNIDSPGGNGATLLSETTTMAEVRALASNVVEAVTGQRLSGRRYGRTDDQSFWGHGIPALLADVSQQPMAGADPSIAAIYQSTTGLGWWWHTPEDTIDKLNPDFLKRDASIYVLLLYQLCTAEILPFDYLAVVKELQATITTLQAQCGDHFDLEPINTQVVALVEALEHFNARLAALKQSEDTDRRVVAVVNHCLMRLGRLLIPIDYTRAGKFDHDLALPTTGLPGLQPAARLESLEPGSDAYEFLRTRLGRERNRVVFAVREASHLVQETLTTLHIHGLAR